MTGLQAAVQDSSVQVGDFEVWVRRTCSAKLSKAQYALSVLGAASFLQLRGLQV